MKAKPKPRRKVVSIVNADDLITRATEDFFNTHLFNVGDVLLVKSLVPLRFERLEFKDSQQG